MEWWDGGRGVVRQYLWRNNWYLKVNSAIEEGRKTMTLSDPFPTVAELAAECGQQWEGFTIAAQGTANAEAKLKRALASENSQGRILDADCCLVLFGSFARYEMLEGSDYDWAVLVDGVVNTAHSDQARAVEHALKRAGLPAPGTA